MVGKDNSVGGGLVSVCCLRPVVWSLRTARQEVVSVLGCW